MNNIQLYVHRTKQVIICLSFRRYTYSGGARNKQSSAQALPSFIRSCLETCLSSAYYIYKGALNYMYIYKTRHKNIFIVMVSYYFHTKFVTFCSIEIKWCKLCFYICFAYGPSQPLQTLQWILSVLRNWRCHCIHVHSKQNRVVIMFRNKKIHYGTLYFKRNFHYIQLFSNK